MSDDVPEQLVPQIAQLKAERAVCEAHGNTDRIAAIDRTLAALTGAESAADADEKAKAARSESPKGRTARQQAKTADAGEE